MRVIAVFAKCEMKKKMKKSLQKFADLHFGNGLRDLVKIGNMHGG